MIYKIVLFFFFIFQKSVALEWLPALDESQQAKIVLTKLYSQVRFKKDFNSKMFDDYLAIVKQEATQKKFDFNKIITYTINAVNQKIEYYEAIKKQGWPVAFKKAGLCVGVATFYALLLYWVHTVQPRELQEPAHIKELENELIQLGAARTVHSKGWASATFLNEDIDKQKVQKLVDQLAYEGALHGVHSDYYRRDRLNILSFFDIIFGTISISSAWGSICCILEYKYSHFYLKKYSLIKKKLEEYIK